MLCFCFKCICLCQVQNNFWKSQFFKSFMLQIVSVTFEWWYICSTFKFIQMRHFLYHFLPVQSESTGTESPFSRCLCNFYRQVLICSDISSDVRLHLLAASLCQTASTEVISLFNRSDRHQSSPLLLLHAVISLPHFLLHPNYLIFLFPAPLSWGLIEFLNFNHNNFYRKKSRETFNVLHLKKKIICIRHA